MKENLYNALLGSAIGDALGVPAEFKSRYELKYKPITDMVDGGIWNQPAGTWSDDTAMSLATIDALFKNDFIVNDKTMHDIAGNFVDWYINGTYAALKNRFDIGNTCRSAIVEYIKHGDAYNCGCKDEHACGNGALMRIIPATVLDEDAILKISRLTHDNITCDKCSLLYAKFINLLQTMDKKEAFDKLTRYCLDIEVYSLCRLKHDSFLRLQESDIKSSGYVVHTLEAAIWCFMNTKSYKECVLKAVNLGDDTDTVAAVAGGLAGLYYGINEEDGIPKDWIYKLRDKNTFDKICRV